MKPSGAKMKPEPLPLFSPRLPVTLTWMCTTAGLALSPIVTNAPAASPPPLTTPFKLPSGLVKPLVK